MSLLSDVVAVIGQVTLGLGFQAAVKWGRSTGDSGIGDPEWKVTTHMAIVEYKVRHVPTSDGRIVASSHSVTFLNPRIMPNEGDAITFKNVQNTVMSVESPVDTTGRLITTVYL